MQQRRFKFPDYSVKKTFFAIFTTFSFFFLNYCPCTDGCIKMESHTMRLIARGKNKNTERKRHAPKETTVHLPKRRKVCDVGETKICDDHAYTMASST